MLAAEGQNLLCWHVLDREHALELSPDGYGPQCSFFPETEVFARALLFELWFPLVEVEQKTSNPARFIRVRVLDLRFGLLFRQCGPRLRKPEVKANFQKGIGDIVADPSVL